MAEDQEFMWQMFIFNQGQYDWDCKYIMQLGINTVYSRTKPRLIFFLVFNNYVSFIEIKPPIKTANNYPKIQEPILLDFKKCRFFYCINLYLS